MISSLNFLLQVLFDLAVILMLLRFLNQACHTEPHNPLTQLIQRLSEPLARPLASLLPSGGTWHWAALVLAIVAATAKVGALAALDFNGAAVAGQHLFLGNLAPLTVFAFGLADVISTLINILCLGIIVFSIMTFFITDTGNPLFRYTAGLSRPLLTPIRRWVGTLSGIDLSPLIALIALQTLKILIVSLLLEHH